MSLGQASYVDCFRGGLGKRLATGCLLQALQQLTGVNFIVSETSLGLGLGLGLQERTLLHAAMPCLLASSDENTTVAFSARKTVKTLQSRSACSPTYP